MFAGGGEGGAHLTPTATGLDEEEEDEKGGRMEDGGGGGGREGENEWYVYILLEAQ